MSMKPRQRRIGIAAAATVSAVAVFSAAGGVGMAGGVISLHQYGPGAGQYQYGKQKVTICHKGKHTIRISERAWPAHIRHGDTEGACANVVKHAKKHHKAEHAGKENAKAGKSHGKKAEQAREAVAQEAEGSSKGKGHNK